VLAFFTLQLSRLVTTTHYEKVRPRSRQRVAKWILTSAGFGVGQEMSRLHQLIDAMNTTTFNPVGLNIVWPKNVGFIFVSDGPSVINVMSLTFAFTVGDRILCMPLLSISRLFHPLTRHDFDSDLVPRGTGVDDVQLSRGQRPDHTEGDCLGSVRLRHRGLGRAAVFET